jgi:hypothetical protein
MATIPKIATKMEACNNEDPYHYNKRCPCMPSDFTGF